MSQGSVQFWAALHRRHHCKCEDEADVHSPLAPRGFWYAHGGFLYDKGEHMDLEVQVPDLQDGDFTWFAGNWLLIFVLTPLAAAVLLPVGHFLWSHSQAGYTEVVQSPLRRTLWRILHALRFGFVSMAFYFYLPAIMTFHNSMLVNSAVHTWGYMRYRDAMSAPCEAYNLPILFPFMLGENNHNNHHGAPSSISTWQAWWEVDVWGPATHALEFVGLIYSHSDFRESRVHPESVEIGIRRGRLDLERPEHLPVYFWEWRWDPAPIWMQWALVLLFYYGCYKWRVANRKLQVSDRKVTIMFVALMILQLLQGLFFIYSDPTLLSMQTDDSNLFLGSGWARAFATGVCRIIEPLHGLHAFHNPLLSLVAICGFLFAVAITVVVLVLFVAVAALFLFAGLGFPLLVVCAFFERLFRGAGPGIHTGVMEEIVWDEFATETQHLKY